MTRTRLQDFVIGLVVAAVGIFGMVNAIKMPDGTRPYTLVVTVIFTALGSLVAVRSVLYAKTESHDCKAVTIKEMINPFFAFLMVVAYAFALTAIGFFVSSAIFMPVLALWMGYRKPIPLICTTAGMLGFIYILFVYQLNVTLPRGILF